MTTHHGSRTSRHIRRKRAAPIAAVAAVTMEADTAAAKVLAAVVMAGAEPKAKQVAAAKVVAKEESIERNTAMRTQTRQAGKSMSRCATPFGVGRRLRNPKHEG